LRWVGVESFALCGGIVFVFFGLPVLRAVIGKYPDEFILIFDDPGRIDLETLFQAKRIDAFSPGLDKCV
jgi:hypothetical protein